MKIGQYTYRYGQAVAILVDQMIRFGNVEKVITQLGKDGETTAVQVIIEKPNAQQADVNDEPERFLVRNGELIDILHKPDDVYGTLNLMLLRSEEYQRAIKFQERVDNPVREVPEPSPAVAEAAPVVNAEPAPAAEYARHEQADPGVQDRDSSSPSPDEGADDVPL